MMDASRITCSVCMEWFMKTGMVTKVIKLKNAELSLVRNEFRDMFLYIKNKENSYKLLFKEVVVHKKFMLEGKATIKFCEAQINILISNAPTTDLVEFLKVLFIKISSKKSSPKVCIREKLLSLKPSLLEEISPVNGKDITRVNENKKKIDIPTNRKRILEPRELVQSKKMRLTSVSSLNAEQQLVLDAVKKGRNVFFTGSAGTGKSYLLRAILNCLPPESMAATASTGAAACLIGGITLHSFAGIGNGEGTIERCRELARRPQVLQNWRRCKHLIIDEISMIDAPFFEKVEQIGREVRGNDHPFGGLQVIVSGDFFQLPPVSKGPAKFCFMTDAWRKCSFQTFELKQIHRQSDPLFITMLNNIRFGRVTSIEIEHFTKTALQVIEKEGILATRLCCHTEEAKLINKSKLEQLQGEEMVYTSQDSSALGVKILDDSTPVERKIFLKVGAQVMLLKNIDISRGLVNGARGIVEKIINGWPSVKFICGVTSIVKPEKWTVKGINGSVFTRKQIPLRLAWAFSIHKSQGLTLDCVEICLTKTFEAGQAYVALSRAKSLNSLRVLGFSSNQVWANPDVLKFYKFLSCSSQEYIPLGKKTH